MKIFVDTEFIEDGKTIELISLGAVDEDGREFYAEVKGVNWAKANDWVVQNVKPHLKGGETEVTRQQLAMSFYAWVSGRQYFSAAESDRPEFWAWYGAYDWVAICQLFGRMIDLPRGWPMYINDIKQLANKLGNPKMIQQSTTAHFALDDAKWNRDIYNFLQRYELEVIDKMLGKGRRG